MPSGHDYGNRLRDDVRRTLSQHIAKLERDINSLQDQVSSLFTRVSQSLAPVRELEISSADSLFLEAIKEVQDQKDKNVSLLAGLGRDLRQQETQEDVLKMLLNGTSHFAPRVALFVARGDQFLGWAALGYSDATAQKLRALAFAQSDTPLLRGALNSDGAQTATDLSHETVLQRAVGTESAAPWYAFSLRALRRPLATLLFAGDSGRTCDLNAISILISMSGICLENLALKIMHDLSAQGPGAGKPVPGPAVHEATSSTGSSGFGSLHGTPAGGASQVSAGAQAKVAEVSKAAEAVAKDKPAAGLDVVREISEDEKLHAEAKRFARLLVSEIKLYNEQRVTEGRAHKDLYVRLKRDIDRSRDMYEKRISPNVSRKVDYFHDEVVRILGENDASTLGSDYPGARVEN
jgi:hypothetical protein